MEDTFKEQKECLAKKVEMLDYFTKQFDQLLKEFESRKSIREFDHFIDEINNFEHSLDSELKPLREIKEEFDKYIEHAKM